MKQEETITIKKETLWKISTFVLLAVIVGYLAFGGGSGSVYKNDVPPTKNAGPTGNSVSGAEKYKQYAEDMGLDKDKFDSCLDSGEMAAEVAKDMQDGQAAGVSGTPGFIINGKLVSGAQPFSVFQAEIESALKSADSAPNMDALVDDDAVKGDADAPVTIVEWSDYECPFCARFYSNTLKQIDDTYIKTGKVKFVYRDFPLSFHPNAQKAAEAAECAGEQGKYFEMHDMLFEKGL